LAKLSLIADVLEVDFVQIIAAPEQQGQAVVNVLADSHLLVVFDLERDCFCAIYFLILYG